MKIIKSGKPRSLAGGEALEQDVKKIITDVRAGGDRALASYNRRFDECERENYRVTKAEIQGAYGKLSPEEVNDLRSAAENIRLFAEKQKTCIKELPDFEPVSGVHLGHRVIPVEAVMAYVPGGNYPLFSTALMLSIPAKVAGVSRVVACSPPVKGKSSIHPKTLVAMDIAGVDEIYAMGGSQAVAAMAYGTESITPVDMIVGPGNSYVTEAKRQCYGKVGIDFPAGPSEVLILADKSADIEILAADLLAQAEHDLVAKGLLITTDETLAGEVDEEVRNQLKNLNTANIAAKAWEEYGEILVVENIEEGISYINDYAPEHLELCVNNPKTMMDKLYNYGSLFLGQNTAEVFGDYASGPNHTLPTLGGAKFTGGVWVGSFLKVQTHQYLSPEASKKLSPLVTRLAKGEGLEAHKKAAALRGK